MAGKRIGIFAGTFDPVHNGHLAFAIQALKQGGLEQVFLVPEPVPRGKVGVAPLRHRVAMLDLAVAGTRHLSVMQLSSRQFTTAHTLPEIRQYVGADTGVCLLLGSDVAKTLPGWDSLPMLLGQVSFMIGLRQHETPHVMQKLMRSLEKTHKIRPAYDIAISPHEEARSTDIRKGVYDTQYVPPGVSDYIARYAIYDPKAEVVQ